MRPVSEVHDVFSNPSSVASLKGFTIAVMMFVIRLHDGSHNPASGRVMHGLRNATAAMWAQLPTSGTMWVQLRNSQESGNSILGQVRQVLLQMGKSTP